MMDDRRCSPNLYGREEEMVRKRERQVRLIDLPHGGRIGSEAVWVKVKGKNEEGRGS